MDVGLLGLIAAIGKEAIIAATRGLMQCAT